MVKHVLNSRFQATTLKHILQKSIVYNGSLAITSEAIALSVKMVPTVFVGNQEFQYPREIDETGLEQVILNQLLPQSIAD